MQRFILPILILVLALAAATVLWAQSTPSKGKSMHAMCAMHTQGKAEDCCGQGGQCCTDGQCATGECTDMACCKDQQCCKDSQCQDCAQGCCTHTAQGMQCTMTGHTGQQGHDCQAHCQYMGCADGGHAHHHTK